MKYIKMVLISVMLIIFSIYLPTSVMATTNNNKIIQEAEENPGTIISIDPVQSRIASTSFHSYVNRSARIQVDRTSTNTGISLNITIQGNYDMDICIFARGTTTVVGYTHTAKAGQMTTMSWSASELGNTRSVDIFMTSYTNVTQYVYGAISY